MAHPAHGNRFSKEIFRSYLKENQRQTRTVYGTRRNLPLRGHFDV